MVLKVDDMNTVLVVDSKLLGFDLILGMDIIRKSDAFYITSLGKSIFPQ